MFTKANNYLTETAISRSPTKKVLLRSLGNSKEKYFYRSLFLIACLEVRICFKKDLCIKVCLRNTFYLFNSCSFFIASKNGFYTVGVKR